MDHCAHRRRAPAWHGQPDGECARRDRCQHGDVRAVRGRGCALDADWHRQRWHGISVNWPTAGLNGAYSIHAVLSDVLGNPSTSTAPVDVTLDNTAPSVILGGIANDAEVHGPVDLSATAADTGGSGVFSVQLELPAGGLARVIQPDRLVADGRAIEQRRARLEFRRRVLRNFR